MAKELVLVSHGRFCEELKASTEMIMGHKNPSIRLHSYQKKGQKTLPLNLKQQSKV